MTWNSEQPERRRNRSDVPLEAAKKQLEYIARENDLKAALLATEEGISVVDIDSQYDADFLAAIAGFLLKTSKELEDLDDLAGVDQISMRTPSGNTLICRFFNLLEMPVVLGILTGQDDAMRPITERAITGILRIFSEG